MTVKVLVTSIGQQIIAETKQIENKDTNEIVGYWLSQPRLVQYSRNEDGGVGVNFGDYCLVSDEAEFSLRGDHVVAILEPRDNVIEAWTKIVYPELPETEEVVPTEETGEGEDSSTDAPVEGLGEGEVLEVTD
tara:strand:+ start:443 stop:841 length:399 start_codon:yes stop_codon:yes gene_type:complete